MVIGASFVPATETLAAAVLVTLFCVLRAVADAGPDRAVVGPAPAGIWLVTELGDGCATGGAVPALAVLEPELAVVELARPTLAELAFWTVGPVLPPPVVA